MNNRGTEIDLFPLQVFHDLILKKLELLTHHKQKHIYIYIYLALRLHSKLNFYIVLYILYVSLTLLFWFSLGSNIELHVSFYN